MWYVYKMEYYFVMKKNVVQDMGYVKVLKIRKEFSYMFYNFINGKYLE